MANTKKVRRFRKNNTRKNIRKNNTRKNKSKNPNKSTISSMLCSLNIKLSFKSIKGISLKISRITINDIISNCFDEKLSL